MNWFEKIAQRLTKLAVDEQQALSGPLVDSIVATVSDMVGRGAPIEKNDYGFNGTDYMDAMQGNLSKLLTYGPGSEVPIPLLVHAVQTLWKYDATQLGGQVRQLREQLQAEMQALQPVQPQQPEQPQPQQPDQPPTTERRVRILGWGSGFNRDMVRIHIPDADSRLSARAVNKMIRDNAQALGWEEEEMDVTLPNGFRSTKWDFPLNKLRRKDKESFDTWMLHKDFIPVLVNHLTAMNQKEAEKAPRARPPREPFLWDLSELEAFNTGEGEHVEQPKPQVQIRGQESNYGNEYFIKFDFTTREFVNQFKSFVKETLDWWWPKWTGNDTKEWHLRGTKNENFDQLVAFFVDNGFDASALAHIAEQLSQQTDAEPDQPTQQEESLTPLLVQNTSGQGKWHMGLSIPRISPNMREKYYQAIKLSFPTWNDQRYLNRDNWTYFVRGTYSDFADFGTIMKNYGFDVTQLRAVFAELMQAGVLQRERLNGELDGFDNSDELRTAAGQLLTPGYELYPAQADGVEFLYGRSSAFLGDETGAGKTIQAIVAGDLRMRQTGGRGCVVTLHATKHQWMREIRKFTGDNSISDDPTDGARWTVLTYPQFSAPKNGPVLTQNAKQQQYQVMILDEVQNTKNKSKRTERIHDLGEKIPFKWGASATISANMPIDVWRQLKSIGHRLGDLSESGFRTGILGQKFKRHKYGGDWVYPGNTPEEQEENALRAAAFLNEWLTKHAGIYIRRTKKDINPNVSNHTVSEAPVQLKPSQIKRFHKAVAERMAQYADPDLAISEMIAQRAEIATAKVPNSLELIENVLAQDKKVLVFTCFRETAAQLHEGSQKAVARWGGGEVLSVLGGDKDREAKLAQFKDDPNAKVLVLSILAGGTGIDLPNVVDDVIMNDFSWTPKEAEQAEGRAYRVTSENDINTKYVLAMDTVDEYFYQTVQMKRRLANEIDKATNMEERMVAQRALARVNRRVGQQVVELIKDPTKVQELADQLKAEAEGLTEPGNPPRQASSWLARVL